MADNQQTDFNYDEMNSWTTDLSVDDYNQQPEFVLPDPDVYTVELVKKHPNHQGQAGIQQERQRQVSGPIRLQDCR
jgi:hypothetical protein